MIKCTISPEEIETVFSVRKVPSTEDGKTKYFYH